MLGEVFIILLELGELFEFLDLMADKILMKGLNADLPLEPGGVCLDLVSERVESGFFSQESVIDFLVHFLQFLHFFCAALPVKRPFMNVLVYTRVASVSSLPSILV